MPTLAQLFGVSCNEALLLCSVIIMAASICCGCGLAAKCPEGQFSYCRLSKKAKFDKRVAVTVFSFPPDKGNVGTAAYLNVFGSIHKVLTVSCKPLCSHHPVPHRNALSLLTDDFVCISACKDQMHGERWVCVDWHRTST